VNGVRVLRYPGPLLPMGFSIRLGVRLLYARQASSLSAGFLRRWALTRPCAQSAGHFRLYRYSLQVLGKRSFYDHTICPREMYQARFSGGGIPRLSRPRLVGEAEMR